MPTHLHNPFFKGIEFFCFFTGILFSVSLLFLAPTVASAESRSFAFWRGVDVIDAIKEQAQEYELVLKKLPNGSETTLYSFNHFAMLADAGINSNTAQLTFGRIQASPDGSEIIIGYGVKEPADNMKLARIEKLNLQDGSRSTIKEWNVNSPVGSFNYDFEPLTVDWSNQKIYFFDTNETNKSVDSLVFLPFSGGEVKLIQEIHGSPETIQLDPQNQNVMVMGEDGFEHGVIYIYDKSGIFSIIKRTDTVPDEHTFSFSASGDEILYLNAPDGGNPSLKSKSISDDSESTRFDYLNLNPGLWNPLASDGDFKDIETFYNEDPSGKIAFVAESLGEYAELVELDLNSGVTTVLSTGEVQVSQKVDSYEDGWLVNFSGTPVAQSQPSSTSVPNASGDYTPVPTPIIPQASSLIAKAGPVSDGGHWKQSSWLGYFWEKPDSAWIFHPVLGWLHVVPNNDGSFWVYTQDLFPISLWLWIQPNQFPYVYAKASRSSGRRVGFAESIETGWSKGVLSNDFLAWDLGSEWSRTSTIDSPFGINLIFTASKFQNDPAVNLSVVYKEPAYSLGGPIDMYLWDSTDHNASFGVTKNSDTDQLVLNERFLTASGHQAVAVHYKQTLPSGVNDLFTFLIDGSTTEFPQPEGTWMKVQLKITATSFAGGMTIEEAKSIVNKLEFIGGTPDPKGEIEQYKNLTPDSSNTQPSAASGSNNVVASVPITPVPVTSFGNEPDFVNGAWLYLDLDKGNLTHWDNQSNQWADWSKIAKPNLTGTTSTTSVSEKYQGMEFSKAVESIMNSSKSEEEKKDDLGAYILGF
ncbi:MAG: hypothetical protein ACJZ5X_03330 [Opitutales bacterium]